MMATAFADPSPYRRYGLNVEPKNLTHFRKEPVVYNIKGKVVNIGYRFIYQKCIPCKLPELLATLSMSSFHVVYKVLFD